MDLGDILAEEVKALEKRWRASVAGGDDSYIHIVVPNVPLPPSRFVTATTPGITAAEGQPATQVDVLLRIPRGYPHAGPDMFWVRPHLRVVGGAMPGAADNIEVFDGKPWQRFSWHLAQPWKPLVCTLSDTYVPFVLRRLREGT